MQLGQFIATAVFLLSNRLHDSKDGDQGLELLCSLLDRDTSLTTALLQDHVPSIRASWESLFKFVRRKHRRHTFRVLTDIGIHNNWLNPLRCGHCLSCAIQMDCYDTVAKVVDYCCGSNHNRWWWDITSAILAACKKGNVECARLLIQHCDINSRILESVGRRPSVHRSMFEVLIKEMEGMKDMESSSNEHTLALDLFLVNGANVDKKTAFRDTIWRRWKGLVGRDEVFAATRPTILDEVFYLNRPLFDKVRCFSKVSFPRLTRTGLLVALEDGSQALRDYFSVRQSTLTSFNWRHVRSVLELLLAEQFTISEKVDLRIIRGLHEFGVDFTMPSVKINLQGFWALKTEYQTRYLDFAWHQFANVNDRIWLLNILLTKAGVIGELVLEGAVAQYGTGGLESLATHLTDFPTKAVRALIRAARANKFQDVEFLLRMGVDPNAFVIAEGLSCSIQAVATRSEPWLPDCGCSLEMIQFLARHGARLVVTSEYSTPVDFANYLMREESMSEMTAKVKYVLSTIGEDKALSRLPSSLLASCFTTLAFSMEDKDQDREQRLELFEYLFRQGAEVSPGSPLAALISANGREELVREVLYSGSDLNAYFDSYGGCESITPLQIAANKGNESLVHLLLREGANVNSPARGDQGYTALQGACQWPPATEEEHKRKMRICRLLINHGADVNSAPPRETQTALASAAERGDLELATLLLREGANINAIGYDLEGQPKTALDEAAKFGRLDMVKFLLNANALSCFRGATGYDGVIHHAEERGHLAVADLIREYAAKVEAGTVFNPELLTPQEELYVAESDTTEESSDDNSESSSDDDAADVGMAEERSVSVISIDDEYSDDNSESPSNDDAEDVGMACRTSEPTDSEPNYWKAAQTAQGEQVIPGRGGPST